MTPKSFRTPAAQEALNRILKDLFKAGDIADLMASVDADAKPEKALQIFEASEAQAVAVRAQGRCAGWLKKEDCLNTEASSCAEIMHSFSEHPVISARAPLREVILSLAKASPVFVNIFGETAACITLRDIQDAPVRMWLFGLISLMETLMYRGVVSQMPGDTWKDFISPGRLARTEALWEERIRRGEKIALVDCLQFADKADILLRNPKTADALHFASRRKGQEYFSELENLRNNLVHSQLLTEENMPTITSLALTMDILLMVESTPLLPLSDKPMRDFNNLAELIQKHRDDFPALASLPGIVIPPPTPKGKLPPQRKEPKPPKTPKTPEAARAAEEAALRRKQRLEDQGPQK